MAKVFNQAGIGTVLVNGPTNPQSSLSLGLVVG